MKTSSVHLGKLGFKLMNSLNLLLKFNYFYMYFVEWNISYFTKKNETRVLSLKHSFWIRKRCVNWGIQRTPLNWLTLNRKILWCTLCFICMEQLTTSCQCFLYQRKAFKISAVSLLIQNKNRRGHRSTLNFIICSDNASSSY